MFTQNSKIKASGDDNNLVINWTIPALTTKDGFKTCPAAGKCAKGCYARQGFYHMSNVSKAHHKNFETTRNSAKFFMLALDALNKWNSKAKKQGKRLVVRIHDSGDFYSADYLNTWIGLMLTLTDVKFYAYTKQIVLIEGLKKQNKIPKNFTVIYSEGGLFDHKIDPKKHRHSRVFETEEALIKAGYQNASKNDLVAIGRSKKIGLIYHGAKSKTWKTA